MNLYVTGDRIIYKISMNLINICKVIQIVTFERGFRLLCLHLPKYELE